MISQKEQLRREMLEKRKSFHSAEVESRSLQILEHLYRSSVFNKATHIMTYMSYPQEVQTDRLVLKALELKKHVSVPVCIRKDVTLFPSEIASLDMLETGYFGLREPKKEFLHPVSAEEIDLIIVPGVVFDRSGNRIGHGMGYYDRFFQSIPLSIPKIALAFDYQVINQVLQPDPWDIPLDGLITEKGWTFHESIIL